MKRIAHELGLFNLDSVIIKDNYKVYNEFHALSKSQVLRYLSPVSQNIVTTFLPLPSFFATFRAAAPAAPAEIPMRSPSLTASSLAKLFASLPLILMTSSYIPLLSISGTNPAPIH